MDVEPPLHPKIADPLDERPEAFRGKSASTKDFRLLPRSRVKSLRIEGLDGVDHRRRGGVVFARVPALPVADQFPRRGGGPSGTHVAGPARAAWP
jgi:hypothetical protein